MKSQLIFVAALLFALASVCSATSEEASSNKSITICPIEYTSLGKSAHWHFNFIYTVLTDADGTVSKVAQFETTKRSAFVNEAALVECVKTWKLLPSGQHVVMFSLGTTGDRNFISITDSDRNVIQLVLP